MNKLIIFILLISVFILGAILLIKEDPGFVLVQYADFSMETTLAVAFVALVIASIVINILFKILIFTLRIGKNYKKRAERRRVERGRILLNKGLIDLTEGRFFQAKTRLTKLIDYAENPLINYLMAARAAHQLGEFDQRDLFLKQAYETNEKDSVAIGVTQGELQLSAKQTERAYATLTNLYQKAPKHDYVLKLLAKVYLSLEEWEKLGDLIPQIKKKNIFAADKMLEIERLTYNGSLNEGCSRTLEQLNKTFAKINKALPHDPIILQTYINRLEQLDDSEKHVEKTIRDALDKKWDKRLIIRYGLLTKISPTELLANAEHWQNEHPYDADLLLTLGRLARRSQLWGKAQSYLEASVSANANAFNCLDLAELLEEDLNQAEQAIHYYQKGLKSCAQKNRY